MKQDKGRSLLTSGVLAGALALCSLSSPAWAAAQTTASAQRPAQSRVYIPDENTLARLVWSSMIALDNANRTENYTVLYRLGSPQFQLRNSPGQLSRSFATLRAKRVDVGRAILSTPTYYIPPQILPDGTLRLRGGFDFRPKSVRFDLIFANIGGGWQINAISVVEMDANAPK